MDVILKEFASLDGLMALHVFNEMNSMEIQIYSFGISFSEF
jgi:hypothetical protein